MPIEPSAINLGAFKLMCCKMRINSKRLGPCPLIPTSTQEYLISEIIKGLSEGVHWFVVLKGRQAKVTTIVLASVIYWMLRHPGMTGLFAIDEGDLKTEMNLLFRDMVKSLEEAGDDWFVPMDVERRELVKFVNGSRISFDN